MDLTIYRYNQDHTVEEFHTLEELKKLGPQDSVWVDLRSNNNKDLVAIAQQYNLHELAIEDCYTKGHFPKIEEFPGYHFAVLRGLKSTHEIEEIRADEDLEEEYNSEKLTRGIGVFIGENFIITHRVYEVSWLDAIVRQYKNHPEHFDNFNAQEIFLRICNILTSRFLRGINYFEDQIDDLEDLVIKEPEHFEMLDLLDIKRDLNILASIMRDQKTIFSNLATETTLVGNRQLRRYFKNIDDRASTIIQGLQRLIDNIASVRDVYLAVSNVRLGDVMRILAVITTIAAPLHLVVGLYGMNFEAIPLLHDKNGFWLIVVVMLSLVLLMLSFFKKKNWI